MATKNEIQRSTYAVFIPLLAISVCYEILPLSEALDIYRPDISAILLIYFAIFDYRRVNVEIAFVAGLIIDLLKGAPLGCNALLLSSMVFAILFIYRKFKNFLRYQQSLTIGLIYLVVHIIGYWLIHVINQNDFSTFFVNKALSIAILWPIMYYCLTYLCNFFGVVPSGETKDEQ